MSPGLGSPPQFLSSLSAADVILGATLALVFGLVWLRARGVSLLPWACAWVTQPAALVAAQESRAGGDSSLAALLAAAGVVHGLALVSAAWLEARGKRSWQAWLLMLVAVAAGALALGALSPSARAGDALAFLPAIASLAGGVLLLTAGGHKSLGRRLAAAGLLLLGVAGLALSAPPAAGPLASILLKAAELAGPLALAGLLAAASGLLLARVESAERSLASAYSRLDGLRQSLAQSAAADPLTGFFNRRAFRELVDHVRDGSATSRGCVMVLDMDGLKRINDTQGHSMGDKAIFRMARVTEAALRAGDLPIRWGGDEFVVVLPGATLPDAEGMRNTIQSGLQREGLLASGGLSPYGPDMDIVLALREADRLMYVSKRQRREAREASVVQLRLPLDENAVRTPRVP